MPVLLLWSGEKSYSGIKHWFSNFIFYSYNSDVSVTFLRVCMFLHHLLPSELRIFILYVCQEKVCIALKHQKATKGEWVLEKNSSGKLRVVISRIKYLFF